MKTAPILVLLPALLAGPAEAGPPDARRGGEGSPLLTARLVVVEAGAPGPAKLGLYVELAAGWHLYWVNPGDSGLAPSVRWALPEGAAAGPLRHPVPRKALREGIVSLEHENPVLFLCEIAPPASGWPAGPWKASAVLEWMACRDSCVTGETAVEALVPGPGPPSARPGSFAEGKAVYERFGPLFPRPLAGSGVTAGPARAEWDGSAWRVEVPLVGERRAAASDFFVHPLDGFVIDNAGVACRDGKIVCPLVPSRGPGSPPPPAVAGVLIVDGIGYELCAAVSKQAALKSPAARPAGPAGRSYSSPGPIFDAAWR
ncbi:MAG TPA: protein-disulfide reductase DsbD family protein [Candidatus Aminicenantes bacterium]|nr:protein-disulfide reductase DsbD family protein [Candidatus Aminicenantes bacterium]